ncbi:calcium-binding protein, partial [Zooshikella sp. WH53]|nr:calcium-binding protein [Zooshikella harenae]
MAEGCVECQQVTHIAATLDAGNTMGEGVRHQLMLTDAPPIGLAYLKVKDPYAGKKTISAVQREDGKAINNANVWLSKERNSDKIHFDYFLNLFDVDPSSYYVIDFGVQALTPHPPVIQYIGDKTTYEGGQVGFIVNASDPNGTIPQLTVNGLMQGAKFTAQGNGQAIFQWLPLVGQAGEYPLTIHATDGQLSAQQEVMIHVFREGDTDGDQLDDEWELNHFGDLSRDGAGDFDNDGYTDLEEFKQGTSPTEKALAPGIPQIIGPRPEEEITSLTPTLLIQNSRHGSEEAIHYRFEVFAEPQMTTLVAVADPVNEAVDTSSITIAESHLQEGQPLLDNHHYYWRVRAISSKGSSEWSTSSFFLNTQNDPPSAIHINEPAHLSVVANLQPTLKVTNSVDPDQDNLTYSFRVYEETDRTFENPIHQVSGLSPGKEGQTAWQIPVKLIENQVYFWIATVTDEHGEIAL